jgi:hypothetical protein
MQGVLHCRLCKQAGDTEYSKKQQGTVHGGTA